MSGFSRTTGGRPRGRPFCFAPAAWYLNRVLIQESKPAWLPKSLTSEMFAARPGQPLVPGLILSAHDLTIQSPAITTALGHLAVPARLVSPALYVSPTETANALGPNELALVKSVCALIAEQVSPHLKTGVDVVWLVYKAAQLKKEWERPDRDTTACVIKMLDVAMSSVRVADKLSTRLDLPDAWSNGVNFAIKSGGAIVLGKTPPMNELALVSMDRRLEVPLQFLKLMNVTLDPQYQTATFARPTFVAAASPGAANNR